MSLSQSVPESFWQQLRQARQRVLFLDYDGTLAPFHPRRDQAVPYPGVAARLDALLADGACRLVLISGRALADLIPLLGLTRLPELWGSHGWERQRPGEPVQLAPLPDAARQGLTLAAQWVRQTAGDACCETKPASVALHWRGRPAAAITALQQAAEAAWQPLALQAGLELHPFDGGLELRIPGRDKGAAVRTVLRECPAETLCAYLGDDRTDEDGFCALPATGLGVLVRDAARPTAARVWLRPPQQLLEFLDRWRQACAGKD